MPRQAELSTASSRVHVVAGILCNDSDQILISDRAQAASMRDYWEFPGGKVNPGESSNVALCRELDEELGITVLACEYLRTIAHDYPNLLVDIDFFVVNEWDGTPRGVEGQALRWVNREALDGRELLPADAPIVASIRTRAVVNRY